MKLRYVVLGLVPLCLAFSSHVGVSTFIRSAQILGDARISMSPALGRECVAPGRMVWRTHGMT